jgi:hypothetical protein
VTGIQGITGIPGTAASQGVTGASGAQGLTGIQGTTGSGIQGATGASGAQGATGLRGITGLQGITGAGIQGVTGVTGIRGVTGAGIQGVTGIQGITGIGLAFNGARAFLSASGTTGVSDASTIVKLNGYSYDTGSNFSSYTYTVPITGYYQINAQVSFSSIGDNEYVGCNINVNGTEAISAQYATNNVGDVFSATIGDIIHLTSAQAVTLCYIQSGATTTHIVGEAVGESTFLTIRFLGV